MLVLFLFLAVLIPWFSGPSIADPMAAAPAATPEIRPPNRDIDIIVVFPSKIREGKYEGDIDIYAQRVTAEGSTLWKESENVDFAMVTESTNLDNFPVAVADEEGGCLIAFLTEVREGDSKGEMAIMVQRMSPAGIRMWNQGKSNTVATYLSGWKLSPPLALADGRSGAFLTFDAVPLKGDYAGDSDVIATRIDKNGSLTWGTSNEPITVAATTRYSERNPSMCADGSGGLIVVFVAEELEGRFAGDADIQAQRLNPDGRRICNNGDSSINVAFSKNNESSPVVVSDGQGGAVVAYQLQIAGDPDSDILAQRISREGWRVWHNGEQSSAVSMLTNISERNPCMVPDGKGGALIFFEAEYLGGEYKDDIDIRAQRITPDGELLWNKEKDRIAIFVASMSIEGVQCLEHKPQAVTDGQGGAIVVYQVDYPSGKYKGDVDIYAQRVSADGKLLWANGNAVELATATGLLERNPVVLADGKGGAVVIYEGEFTSGEYQGDSDIFIQWIKSDGTLVFPKSVLVGTSDLEFNAGGVLVNSSKRK